MRVPDSVKNHSGSMLICIEKYGHQISDKIPIEQFSVLKVHNAKSNRWTDMMNNTWRTGCEPINDINHRQTFELLSYASYFHQWKQSVNPDNFVPELTYKDVVMTSLGVVLTARTYLPMWSRGG